MQIVTIKDINLNMDKAIHILHGFISNDRCRDIRADLNKNLWDAKDPFIKTGFSVSVDQSVDYYYHNSSELN